MITIYGSTPSKKNSRILFLRKGSLVNIPGKVYVTWKKEAEKQLLGVRTKLGSSLRLVFFSKDARKWDLTNRAESVMDVLVDCGLLIDDNYSVVSRLVLEYGGIDRSSPRVEIYNED